MQTAPGGYAQATVSTDTVESSTETASMSMETSMPMADCESEGCSADSMTISTSEVMSMSMADCGEDCSVDSMSISISEATTTTAGGYGWAMTTEVSSVWTTAGSYESGAMYGGYGSATTTSIVSIETGMMGHDCGEGCMMGEESTTFSEDTGYSATATWNSEVTGSMTVDTAILSSITMTPEFYVPTGGLQTDSCPPAATVTANPFDMMMGGGKPELSEIVDILQMLFSSDEITTLVSSLGGCGSEPPMAGEGSFTLPGESLSIETMMPSATFGSSESESTSCTDDIATFATAATIMPSATFDSSESTSCTDDIATFATATFDSSESESTSCTDDIASFATAATMMSDEIATATLVASSSSCDDSSAIETSTAVGGDISFSVTGTGVYSPAETFSAVGSDFSSVAGSTVAGVDVSATAATAFASATDSSAVYA